MRRPYRHHLAVLALGVLLPGIPACENGTEPTSDPITGTWSTELVDGEGFLVITGDSLVVYQLVDGLECASRFAFGLESVEGIRYRLTPAFTSTGAFEATLTAEDDALSWPDSPFARSYVRSQDDPTGGRPFCLGGGADAEDCASLPELPAGEEVTDSLTTQDPQIRGFFYDLYRLEPVEAGEYTVAASSTEFDTWLYLYDAGGSLVGQNDDAGPETTDSALTASLQAACYRVEVTSFSTGETGAYTLDAE